MTLKEALYEAPGPKTRRNIRIATVFSVIFIAVLIVLMIRQFYVSGQFAHRYWSFFGRMTTWKFFFEGLLGTVKAALMAAVITFCLGFLMMTGRISHSRILNAVATALVEFTRGVPTLLFIYFFFLVVPQTGIKLSAFWKVALPVAISASGMVAEVLRGGVNSVPKGHKEAALSLGMGHVRTFIKIIFPQAFRYVIPALISEIVIVLKDTTFAYVVSYNDLMQNASVLISNYDALLSVYLVVAVIYILINYLLNRLSVKLASKQQRRK